MQSSKDSEFERYKRKKKEDREYQFKKKGRNIFDSDKGEEYESVDYEVRRKRGKKYARTVGEEEEKKLEFSSREPTYD